MIADVSAPDATSGLFHKYTYLANRLQANQREARTLAALRDTLLPQLISNELRVQAAAEFIEGVG